MVARMGVLTIALLICAVFVGLQSPIDGVVHEDKGQLATTNPGFAPPVTRDAFTAMDSVTTVSKAPTTITDFKRSTNMTEDFTNLEITTFITDTMSSPSDSLDYHKGDANYRIVLEYLGKIVTPVTLAVGLTGNGAILFALQGQAFNKIPSRYILSGLAVSDSLALIMNVLNKKIVLDLLGHDIRAYDRTSCKVFHYFSRFGIMLSSWFVVLICCERFVAICLPLRARQICTKSNALWAIAIVVISIAVFNGIWTLSTEKQGSKCNTSFWIPETKIRTKVIMSIGSALIALIPMVIMVILTPTMCIVLHRNHLSRKRLTTSGNPEQMKISAMLISVCIAYIVLMLPSITAFNISFARGENMYATQFRPIVILNAVGEHLIAINFSCNFFLYVACNTSFRRRLCHSCRNRKCQKEASQVVEPTVTPTIIYN